MLYLHVQCSVIYGITFAPLAILRPKLLLFIILFINNNKNTFDYSWFLYFQILFWQQDDANFINNNLIKTTFISFLADSTETVVIWLALSVGEFHFGYLSMIGWRINRLLIDNISINQLIILLIVLIPNRNIKLSPNNSWKMTNLTNLPTLFVPKVHLKA